jgi:ferredoxin-thioredoxin reductase catalytic subunit/rubredoxin
VEVDESREEIDALLRKLAADAASSGYFLNPDKAFTWDLACGLVANLKRYGYPSCPCRLASGEIGRDRDIVCPCDYRDPDLSDYGACYCALYVSEAASKDGRLIAPVPERRGVQQTPQAPRPRANEAPQPAPQGAASYPVWRCRVCGYLCARESPPEVCPICKVKKDRFERFGGLVAAVG